MIDFNKPVQTRAGEPVRILCTDMKNTSFPVIGLVTVKGGKEHLFAWSLDGRIMREHETSSDLINIPENRKVAFTFFIACNGENLNSFFGRGDADTNYLRDSLSTGGWKVLHEETLTREVTL